MIFYGALAAAAAPSNDVKGLQTALAQLAQASGQAGIDPGPIDGLVTTRLKGALGAALSYAIPKLSSDKTAQAVATAASFALIVAPSSADSYIRDAAGPITTVLGLVASQLPGNLMPIAPAQPWYKTTAGMAAVGGAGLLAVLLVLAVRSPATLPAGAA